ncbi:MAG: GNAT family N-acetyltransferase [Planctomycetota bacterium]
MKKKGFKIRQYRNGDFAALAAVWKACDMDLDESDTAQAIARNQRRRRGWRVFVVEPPGATGAGELRLAGGAIITFDGHRAYVYHLVVHPAFRDAGLGRLLLERCERQALAWGARHLRLTSRTDASRSAARRMYAAAGWRARKELWVYSKDL